MWNVVLQFCLQTISVSQSESDGDDFMFVVCDPESDDPSAEGIAILQCPHCDSRNGRVQLTVQMGYQCPIDPAQCPWIGEGSGRRQV
jgi:hypothetical protein